MRYILRFSLQIFLPFAPKLENLKNENNVWLCPIFKKCNKQKLAELKAKHLKILGLLTKTQRQKYDELHEKYPAITDL